MGAIDISNFYIHNDLKEYQYMRFHISMIPQEIIDEYNLQDIVESEVGAMLKSEKRCMA
jgi:hypothetical protein